jgi:hypothetical protein
VFIGGEEIFQRRIMNFRIIFLTMILAGTVNTLSAEKTIAEETQKLAEDNGKPCDRGRET